MYVAQVNSETCLFFAESEIRTFGCKLMYMYHLYADKRCLNVTVSARRFTLQQQPDQASWHVCETGVLNLAVAAA